MTIIQNLKNMFKINAAPDLTPADLDVHRSGVEFVKDKDEMDYLWFELEETEAGVKHQGYRVVRLRHLTFIPLEARSDAGLIQKMRTVLRGAVGAEINLVYSACGIFEEPALGVAQCYGVSTFVSGADQKALDCAVQKSARDLAVLEGGLKGEFGQMRLSPLSVRMANWIYSSLTSMPYALVAVGHPDPRENAREGGSLSPVSALEAGGRTSQAYSTQQNEILYRGMASLEEEFLLMVLTNNITVSDVSKMLIGLGEETSIWASQQTGTKSASFGISLPALLSGAMAETTAQNYGQGTGHTEAVGQAQSVGHAQTQGQAHTTGHAESQGWSHTVGISVSDSNSQSVTDGVAHTEGQGQTIGSSHSEGASSMSGGSHSTNSGWNGGLSIVPAGLGIAGGVSGGSADGNNWASGHSSSDTSMQSSSTMQSDSTSHAVTNSKGSTVTASESWGTSGSVTDSVSDTTSDSQTEAVSDTQSTSIASAQATTIGSALGHGVSNGLAVGVAPSASISNSQQWQYDPAILYTQLLRIQQRLLNEASAEGGAYYTDVYALTRTERGLQAMMGLIPESFQGTEDVVAGVQCRTLADMEQEYIRRHAFAWTPSLRMEKAWGAFSAYMDATVLTMRQLSAYTAPGMFEQGTALTIQESTPKFGYFPQMNGEMMLGFQYSTENGELTTVHVRLSASRHFHTAFIGDTGFGKSIAAERLAFETTLHMHMQTIVFDFADGWTKSLYWPRLEERVDIRQVNPGAARPLRWNILQIPKRITPDQYLTMVCEMFIGAGKMGARQMGFMRAAILEVYARTGVLFTAMAESDKVPPTEKTRLSVVSDEEAQALGLQMGEVIFSLSDEEAQALSVYRSKKADLYDAIRLLQIQKDRIKDQQSRTSVEGLLQRLNIFAEAPMRRLYGSGYDALDIEDIAMLGNPEDPWGVTIISGPSEMDEYSKVAIFSLLARILHLDAIKRRKESIGGKHYPPMQIFFEEANKVLGGISNNNDKEGSSFSLGALWESIWRDARKYKIFLHVLAQSVSQLPPGILSSCANVFIFQTKNDEDGDMLLAHIGKSTKGLVNTEYKRFLSRIPISYCITKLGYSQDVNDIEALLMRPLILDVPEPTEAQIISLLGHV